VVWAFVLNPHIGKSNLVIYDGQVVFAGDFLPHTYQTPAIFFPGSGQIALYIALQFVIEHNPLRPAAVLPHPFRFLLVHAIQGGIVLEFAGFLQAGVNLLFAVSSVRL